MYYHRIVIAISQILIAKVCENFGLRSGRHQPSSKGRGAQRPQAVQALSDKGLAPVDVIREGRLQVSLNGPLVLLSARRQGCHVSVLNVKAARDESQKLASHVCIVFGVHCTSNQLSIHAFNGPWVTAVDNLFISRVLRMWVGSTLKDGNHLVLMNLT